MKRIEISIDSPAGRTVCALAEQLNLDPQDVLQGILFGLCNRRKRKSSQTIQSNLSTNGQAQNPKLTMRTHTFSLNK
ncbi:MAG: hypothetical protein IKZ07_01150 [Akkermansia sp.]|nr:hypothetical protein [Akkermansia sp.]